MVKVYGWLICFLSIKLSERLRCEARSFCFCILHCRSSVFSPLSLLFFTTVPFLSHRRPLSFSLPIPSFLPSVFHAFEEEKSRSESGFVTSLKPECCVMACKTHHFALQNAPFCIAKLALLECKTHRFGKRYEFHGFLTPILWGNNPKSAISVMMITAYIFEQIVFTFWRSNGVPL